MNEDKISSNESEGAFHEFIEEQVDHWIEGILSDSYLENLAGRGSDIIVEVDSIEPPRFIYENEGSGNQGSGNQGAGKDSEKIRFSIPFRKLMQLLSQKLELPNLKKEGQGKIKKISQEFKTFGPVGILLDKKRTFKKALKTSIATGIYVPDQEQWNIQIRRQDKRFKLPEDIEKPKFRAVVFYMGDISFSTQGERLELEKKLVSFIQNWVDYNYGVKNVEHRFFVHDSKAYEVLEEDFFRVDNAGGTEVAPVFKMVSRIALSEYDPRATNFYGFYFGDGEVFEEDQKEVKHVLEESMRPFFNRIGITLLLPSRMSILNQLSKSKSPNDPVLRFAEITHKNQIIDTIKILFGEFHAKR
jgi:uncharacterized sporulation protein YeaH/YhbH (DUF444 family)